MTQIRNTKKQWVWKYCCRSVAAELLSTGKHVHSQIILILISYNVSQFVVWALPRSVKPNRLSTPYLGVVTSGLWVTTLIWASWGSEVLWLLTGSGMFETPTQLCLEMTKFAVHHLFCMPLLQETLGGSSTQQNYMIEAFMSYWKSSTAWRNSCSLLHQ